MPESVGYNNNSLKVIGPKIQKIQTNGPVNSDKRIDPTKAMDLQKTQSNRQNTGVSGRIDPSLRERGSLGQPRVLSESRDFELKTGPGGRSTGAQSSIGRGGPAGGPGGPGRLGDQPAAPPEAAKATPEKFGFQKVIRDNIPDDLKEERVIDVDRFRQRLDRSVDTLNKRMEELGRSVRFSRDKEFDREIISVVNPESGDLIRQIPPDYAIRVSEGLKSLRGMLFDDKA